MRFRSGSHCIYRTEYHVVWIPRYRKEIFVSGVREYAEDAIRHTEGLDPDIEVIKLNVRIDHIHLVIVVPPRVAVADVVGYIKTRASKALTSKFPFLKRAIWGREGIWARGYCVSGIGLNEKEVLAYVEHQDKEDRGQLQLKL
jgi:putative transposase